MLQYIESITILYVQLDTCDRYLNCVGGNVPVEAGVPSDSTGGDCISLVDEHARNLHFHWFNVIAIECGDHDCLMTCVVSYFCINLPITVTYLKGHINSVSDCIRWDVHSLGAPPTRI